MAYKYGNTHTHWDEDFSRRFPVRFPVDQHVDDMTSCISLEAKARGSRNDLLLHWWFSMATLYYRFILGLISHINIFICTHVSDKHHAFSVYQDFTMTLTCSSTA